MKSKNKNFVEYIECDFYLSDSPTFKGYRQPKVPYWNGWLQPFVDEKVFIQIQKTKMDFMLWVWGYVGLKKKGRNKK